MASRVPDALNRTPSITFHRKTFGKNIQLDKNALRATRHTSFDNGITFSQNPIKPDERVSLKVIDTDDSGQWLGSLAIGFTQIDPSTIPQTDLQRTSLPNLSKQSGTSYIQRIAKPLTKDIVITYYYNQNGAFYILDGEEHDLHKNIDVKKSLWAVIDIYGNVKAVELTVPPKRVSDEKAFFAKFPEKPDRLRIRYFTHLRPEDLQAVSFSEIHGTEIDLYCENKVVLRKNIRCFNRPYLFIDLPMTPGDELYLRILSIDATYRTAGVLGFTNAPIPTSSTELNQLPAGDPAALVDRSEFWILSENSFREQLNELDEIRIVISQCGEIYLWQNDLSEQSKRLIAFADPDIPFYPFLFLNGRINALSIFGLKSNVDKSKKPKKNEGRDTNHEDAGLCQICVDKPANCVLIPCGHVFFCMDCRNEYEKTARNIVCPLCGDAYDEGLQIAED